MTKYKDNKTFLIFSTLLILFPLIVLGQLPADRFTIVLDPGHGGKDHGCSGHGSIEKKIVLDISKRVRERLLEDTNKFSVILTRNQDRFVPLYKRADIANSLKADLFISIHCNAINHTKTHGTETYVMGLHTEEENFKVAQRENASIFMEKDFSTTYDGFDPNSLESHIFLTMTQSVHREQSIRLADMVESEFRLYGERKSRGVKEAGFVVLRATTMPSILIENGFLTHKVESEFLASKEGLDIMSECIYRAIMKYYHLEMTQISKALESRPMDTKLEDSKYSIQIMALQTKLPIKEIHVPDNKLITIENKGGIYRYYYGGFANRTSAERILNELRKYGHSEAFIKEVPTAIP